MKRRAAVTAVVVAAGRSKRMGRLGDKTWIRIAGRPVLFYSLKAFRAAGIRRIVVVVPPDRVLSCAGRLRSYSRAAGVDVKVVGGGRERQDSVWNGISVADTEFVLVHDGARPAVSPDLIRRICAAAFRHGAAAPVLPVADTLKRVVNNRIIRTESRAGLFAVQTPQGFRRDLLRAAIAAASRRGVRGTDCASLMERMGNPVAAVAGDPANLKLTSPGDLGVLRAILSRR